MARKAAFTTALVILAAALQFSLLRYADIAGAAPDLPLVLTVVVGLLSGPRAGMAVGFGSGLLEGALLGRWIGWSAGAKTVAGYLAGAIGRRVFPENLVVIMVAAALLTLAHDAALGVCLRWGPLGDMAGHAAGRAAYDGAVAAVIGLGLRRVRHLLPPEEVTS